MLTNRVVMGSITKGKFDDISGSPGSNMLIGGSMLAGYFGIVPTSELFTGEEISSVCGITDGILQYNNVGWLKFAIDGKIIFKSQKPYRYNLNYSSLVEKNVISGNKVVSKNGNMYKVRLINGALTNPANTSAPDKGAVGSEWNRLMLPIHINAKTQSWYDNVTAGNPTEYWGIDFTDEDLVVNNEVSPNGCYHFCQEVSMANSNSNILRGYYGVSHSSSTHVNNIFPRHGWSPVLELDYPTQGI